MAQPPLLVQEGKFAHRYIFLGTTRTGSLAWGTLSPVSARVNGCSAYGAFCRLVFEFPGLKPGASRLPRYAAEADERNCLLLGSSEFPQQFFGSLSRPGAVPHAHSAE